jgi:pimeloyl-ACP methyl ester carboxylesterase
MSPPVYSFMTMTQGLITRSLDVAGARLHYEVRGSGPLLFVIGSPMAAAEFAPLAHELAATHTVVTYDPRGLANSTIDDPDQDSTPELRADDVAAIIDAMGAERADVFGSSGGAVTGLALAVRHPGKVGVLVAHEPPVTELLPEAAQQRAVTEDIIETFHRDGPEAAWQKFMTNAGFDTAGGDQGAPVGPQPTADEQAKQLADMTRFFDHEMRDTIGHVPDVAALEDGPARVVIGIGAESGNLLTYRTSEALARQLGVQAVVFPGDHGGFIDAPGTFADVLRKALSG